MGLYASASLSRISPLPTVPEFLCRPLSSMAARSFWIGLLALVAGGCSVERFLAEDELLYEATEIEFSEGSDIPDPDQLRLRLQAQVQQEAATQVGMWWWYKLKPAEDSAKGIKPWLWRTLGTEPSYYDEIQASRTEALMADYLKDHGYFGTELERDTIHPDRNHVVVQYALDVPGRARMTRVVWPRDTSSAFGSFLADVQPGEYVREGEYYTVAALAAERERIDRLGARRGFFEFATNNIYYVVDSNATAAEGGGLPGVGVYLRLERGEDSLAFSTFSIGNTYVYPDFSPSARGDTLARQDTTVVEGDVFTLRREDAPVRIEPPTVARRVGLREGDLYDRQIYENTVNQLLDLGVFSYVNYTFQRRPTDSSAVLDQYIYLTQGPSRRFGVDLEGTTQIGFVPGFNATVRFGHTNLFGGAEDFNASVSAGAGLQSEFGDVENTVLATDYSAQTEIAIPRFIGPFARAIERQTLYIPRTVAELRYQFTDRPEFGLQRAGIRLGYRAQLNRRTSVGLYPATFSYTNLISPSDTFQRALDASPRLEQSFASNAIAAIEGEFQYTSLSAIPMASQWNVKVGVKSAGAIVNGLLGGWGPVGENEILGVAASQYLRSHVDARYTKPFSGWTLATRAYGGVGVPYGNSNTIPFVDQFFVGGPNSMRGFRLRGIGPGAALPPGIEISDEDGTVIPVDATNFNQTGDIRLEANAEARFPLLDPFLKGAVFVDAGNVWLYNDIGEEAPEGLFGRLTAAESFDVATLFDQFAVSVGAGLRIDIEFLVLRFDFGAPVRKPYLVPFGRDPWDFSTLNLFDGDTRDLTFQFGIGYPF